MTSQGSGKRSPRLLPTGTVLEGRYEILRVAGRGGMSTVYAARDLRFGQVERLCAIKEMVDSETDPGTRALSLVNFEREAALLATIAHPAVPKIFDYFAYGGMIYLVLEFIDGDDLERALARRSEPFPEDLVVEWAIQICDVLEMLHAYDPAPVIFRDLKPSNIMLRSTGRIALIDFGIARTFQASQRGTMIGTEGYAPPEQYRGLADARGDIYALGATMHHLVTRSDPRQQTPFTFHERPVRSLNPVISEELADIIARMVAYHPDQRFQTATELRMALEALQRPIQGPAIESIDNASHPALPETRPPMLDRRSPQERRRPSRKRSVRRRRLDADIVDRAAWSVETGDEVRGTAAFDGENIYIGSYDRHLYCLSPDDGTIRWAFETGRGVVARPAIVAGSVLVGSEDSAVYCLDHRSGRAIWQTRTNMPVRSSPTVDDSSVFVGSDDGLVYALDLVSGEVRWRRRTWGPVRSSPRLVKGRVVIGSDDGYVYALDPVDGNVVWRKQSGGAVQSEPVSYDKLTITTSRTGGVVAFDSSTGERRWMYRATGPVISSPRVQQDLVIFGVADGAIVALNVFTGEPVWIQRYANQVTSTPLLGESLGYIGTIDGACIAFAVDTGEMAWKHEVGGSVVSSPCLAGNVLAIGSTNGRVYGVALADWELQELETIDGSS